MVVGLCYICIMPRLHQDTCRPETCIPDEQLVSGYIYVNRYMSPDTSCSSGIHVDCISATKLLFIYVTVDLYPFVSSNTRATNWQQFCRRYKIHVDGDKWIQVDTTCIRQHVSWCINAALDKLFTLSSWPPYASFARSSVSTSQVLFALFIINAACYALIRFQNLHCVTASFVYAWHGGVAVV